MKIKVTLGLLARHIRLQATGVQMSTGWVFFILIFLYFRLTRDLSDRCLIWAMPSSETPACFGKPVPIPPWGCLCRETFRLYQWITAAASPLPQKPLLCSPRARAQEPRETYQRRTECFCRSVRWHVACRHTLSETGYQTRHFKDPPCCQGHCLRRSGSYGGVWEENGKTFKS